MLTYNENTLIPAIVQDAITGRVLMLGWMNEESLACTRQTGEVWFCSRSRQQLWHKGETSGNVLRVRELRADCDADAILVRAEPAGPTCHTGRESCFWQDLDGGEIEEPPRAGFLDELDGIVDHAAPPRPTAATPPACSPRAAPSISQKVGEEGLETAMAGVAQDDDRLIDEAADLLYHLLVLLNERRVPLRAVLQRLSDRHAARSSEH